MKLLEIRGEDDQSFDVTLNTDDDELVISTENGPDFILYGKQLLLMSAAYALYVAGIDPEDAMAFPVKVSV